MDNNSSQLNDLASVDMMFAEMMAESGINPIPTVCDGCDMSILDKDKKIVGQAFSKAADNISVLITSLDNSMDFDNKDSVGRIIDNLKEKQQLILNSKENFNKEDFDFVELYTSLKKVQNKLGLNLNCPEMNVLNMSKENFDVEKTKEKVLSTAKELDDFLKAGEQNYQDFIKGDAFVDTTQLSDRLKEKIEQTKRRKQIQQENQARLARTMIRQRQPQPEISQPSYFANKNDPEKSL